MIFVTTCIFPVSSHLQACTMLNVAMTKSISCKRKQNTLQWGAHVQDDALLTNPAFFRHDVTLLRCNLLPFFQSFWAEGSLCLPLFVLYPVIAALKQQRSRGRATQVFWLMYVYIRAFETWEQKYGCKRHAWT